MKRKIILLTTAILLTLMLSSCLDAIEYITLDDDGDIKLSFMITISKGLFEMGGGEDSVEDTFEEEIIDPEELAEMIPDALSVEARQIVSDVDYGYLFTFTLPRDYSPAEDTPMAPRFTETGIEILLGIMDEEEIEEEDIVEGSDNGKNSKSGEGKKARADEADEPMDQMSEAIFASAKYKVQISKQLLSSASRAYFYSSSGEETSVDLVDLGDNYLVNLPMLLVMGGEEDIMLVFEY